tara:strand:- start:47 stop:271 length:225 start_codon:yes stop_codon:yes gene_type:complete
METEVKWGTIVHPDNTIEKRVISKFEDKETMFYIWKNANTPKITRHMDIQDLTITSRAFVDFSEYLEYMGDEEE